ncbi:MAG: ubiquinol-cytochrome c reductase cytochrome b subunit, partial [Actinomycetota bacterium]|nr:ubiquinol-cytochrome c reductase cytochrome b subunit [Actinomycetota bacterium]
RPVRSGIGAGVLTFYGVLLLAASNDVIARNLHASVSSVTAAFRIALIVLPVVVGMVVCRWFLAVKASGAEGVAHVSFRRIVHPHSEVG